MGYRSDYKKKVIDLGDFQITIREIIASISIIAILLLFGVLISGKISEHYIDKNEIYNKAIKIEEADMFEYGMRTNVGNAFVYGDLKAVDTVTYPELDDEYMYVEKIKERYTRHTRQVAHTRTVNGKTQTYYTTEVYYSWDRVDSDDLKCKEVSFLGVTFDSNKISLPAESYITTIKESSKVRYKYYGTDTEHIGTIFTELKDKTITDHTPFYKNQNITETVECLEVSGTFALVIFWLAWVVLIGGCVYGFYYIDNRWLE
jgi:hypothetical protein